MSAQDIFETISSQYFQLTNSEKKVADYVLAHRMDAQYMSISELAEECAVADATISRFCRRLGLGGYNTFKLELAKASMAAHSARRAGMEEGGRDGFEAMCRERMQESTAALEQTVKRLDPEALKRAADLLFQAGRVLCMGQGSSMVLAEEAWTLLSSISPKFVLVPDSHQQMAALALMEEGDAALYFSYSGSTREIQDALEVAHARKGKVILITRFPKSPGGLKADVVLQCGSNEGPSRPGRFPPGWLSCLYWTCCTPSCSSGLRSRRWSAGSASPKPLHEGMYRNIPPSDGEAAGRGDGCQKTILHAFVLERAELLGLQHRRSPKEAVFPTASRGPGIEMPDLRFFRSRSSTKHDNITNWS